MIDQTVEAKSISLAASIRRKMAAGDLSAAVRDAAALARLTASPDAYCLAGLCALAAGQASDALSYLRQGNAGESAEAMRVLAYAKAHQAEGDLLAARRWAQRACDIDPASDDAKIHLQSIEYELGARGRLEGPLPRNVGEAWPENSRSCFRRLRDGDLTQGFADLAETMAACRPDLAGSSIEAFGRSIPRWDGSNVDRLLIVASEGFGDCLQWARYFAGAAKRVGSVIVATYPALTDLFERSGVQCTSIHAMEADLAKADAYIPAALLNSILNEGYSNELPYLRCDSPVPLSSDRLNVGIAWAGNVMNATDDVRSATVADLDALSSVPGVRFVNLMVGDRARIAPTWIEAAPLELESFDETARLVSALDLVITVDTSVAHLAGALGVPTWIALADRACWRWERDDRRSNWYPAARLFRQRSRGDWVGVFTRMADALEHVLRPWTVTEPLFTDQECEEIIAQGLNLPARPGRLNDGSTDGFEDASHFRAARVNLRIDDPRFAWVYERLLAAAARAGSSLGTGPVQLYEHPHILRYGPGDHFAWHVDEEGRGTRRLSCTVQLTAPGAYDGGALQIMRPRARNVVEAQRDRGCAVFFPSDCLHTVAQINSGERQSLVLWLHGVG